MLAKDERIQVTLASGPARLTAWLNQELKVGQQITLKNSEDPNRWWTVLAVSAPRRVSEIKSNRDWKVGGL